MAGKYYWIKERNNPQFDKPYYVGYGRITIKQAKKFESPLYGDNYMMSFDTEEDYLSFIRDLQKDGHSVNFVDL